MSRLRKSARVAPRTASSRAVCRGRSLSPILWSFRHRSGTNVPAPPPHTTSRGDASSIARWTFRARPTPGIVSTCPGGNPWHHSAPAALQRVDPGEQLEIRRIGEIQFARVARREPAKLNVLRVPQKRFRPRPAANQEDVIHAWTIRTNFFFDLA